MRARPVLSDTPAVMLPALALFLAVHTALKGLFFWRPYLHQVALPIEAATAGLVTTVTLAGVISWVALGAVVLGVARLRPAHVGLRTGALREAVPVLVGLWLVSQALHVAIEPRASIVPTDWFAGGLWPALGQRVQSVVGSGLLEETIFRGFLLVQVYALCRGRLGRERALAWAVVLSSAYFGLCHIPAGLRGGLSVLEASGFALYSGLVGAMFAVLYLRTGNLFVAAGAHALINDPVPVVAPTVDPSVVVLIASATLMLAWPALARQFRFTVGFVEGRPAI